ncbi:MAG: hypothetical protein GY796_24830 [Chloroflexi bacterium]|nr:hypothetical protein [Chloroflexota bacterium]
MLKKRLIAVIAGLALLAAVTGSSGLVADAVGLDWTPQTHACGAGGSGGEC